MPEIFSQKPVIIGQNTPNIPVNCRSCQVKDKDEMAIKYGNQQKGFRKEQNILNQAVKTYRENKQAKIKSRWKFPALKYNNNAERIIPFIDK